MSKISAVVTAYNEEKNIERTLKSLKFADEVIVVDNSSTDNTSGVAKKYADKVFTQENNPLEIDIQKNFGFSKASGDWILSIDADEEASPQLITEIKKAVASSSKNIVGYWIPRKNYIFGKWISENTGWYPDYQLRLFRKGSGKYEKKHVHEHLVINGQTEKLKEHIIHHNYESVAQFVSKIARYAPNEAEELLRKGYVFSYFDVIRFPVSDFLNWFFARKGYKDGFHGLVISLLMSFYHLLVFAFIWEKKGFVEYDGNDFLAKTEGEFKKAGKDIAFWLSKEKIESINNPLRKNIAKIKNKLS